MTHAKYENEIRNAVRNLGYKKGTIHTEVVSYCRIRIFINCKRIGIYDLNKHTFVD